MDFSFSPRQAYLYQEFIKDLSPEERLILTFRLSKCVIMREREEIAKKHPELSPQEVNFRWMETAYGKKLTDEVREHLKKREMMDIDAKS